MGVMEIDGLNTHRTQIYIYDINIMIPVREPLRTYENVKSVLNVRTHKEKCLLNYNFGGIFESEKSFGRNL